MNIREILDTYEKEELIERLINLSDNECLMLDALLLNAPYEFTFDVYKELWDSVYGRAVQDEDNEADILMGAADAIVAKVQEMDDPEMKTKLAKMLVDDLTRASEEDGIGMESDSEWLYMDARDKMVELLENE